MSLVPSTDPNQSSLLMVPPCLGILIASGTSMGLLWLRRKFRFASTWSAVAVVLWFVGLIFLGWGGFAAFSPGESDMMTNLGMTVAMCLAPGIFSILLGLVLYGYDYRRSRRTTPIAKARAVEKSPHLSDILPQLQRANEYRNYITDLIKRKKAAGLAMQREAITLKADQWVARIRQLAQRLEAFEANQVLQRDLAEVPTAISRLEAQLKTETNSQVMAQMQNTLEEQRAYQDQLKSLKTLMHRTSLEIDETLASMGTIYSQLQLLEAKDLDQGRASRLSEDIEEEVNRLNDLLSAMDETYRASGLTS